MKNLLLVLLCCVGLNISASQILVVNANIQTIDTEFSFAEALCIADGIITYIGTEQGARACFNKSQKVQTIDAGGKVILPGLIDSHMHIFSGSSSATKVNLSLAEDLETLTDALKFLAQDASEDVVYARGWQNHIFDSQGPRKTLLDEIFGNNRKVILGSVDGHSTWFSSAALRAAGVDKSIIDPEPGVSFWERDKQTGELLGTSREGAGSIVRRKLITSDKAFYKQALKRWLPQANRSGLTTVFDAGMGAPTEQEAWQILAELSESENLSLRVYGVAHDNGDDPELLVRRLKAYQDNYQSDLVQPLGLKLNADGVPEAHTAFMIDDYRDRPGDRGKPLTSFERLRDIIKVANKAMVPVHIHAIGDAAIDMSISAIEEAANPEIAWQNAIAHVDFVREKEFKRFREQAITAQMSIQWATVDPSFYSIGKFVGMDTMERAYPAKSFIDSDVNVSFGSDWPAAAYLSTFEPFTLIEVAQTRRLPGYTDGPYRAKEQQLSLLQTLYAYTMGSAKQLGIADKVGSLEVGKQADLIILAHDIFSQPKHEIHTNYSLLTMVNGKIVHNEM